ncbi:MAG TPA: TMEM14 family protein [Verrucomicrobiae bacterium]|jgi:uncharacterized membrane protein (UPF0136 family)|nr:TMEM14 family protein [Verrucomicrobiae bacterium]
MPTPLVVLWVYIVLLFAGGLMGFLKAGSKMSLLMATAFAVVLILCATRVITEPRAPDYIMVFLFIFFAVRLTQSKKFMPNGLMSLITLVAIVLRHIHFR